MIVVDSFYRTNLQFFRLCLSLFVRLYIYIFDYIAIHETGLSGNVVASFFPLIIFIYSALLQRIEHCSTRKSTRRLPIYI